ncbi:hypothetical protein ABZX40_31595 [Streptomyces sp. NPDC004610]|uniref:hypothetical protein n=1 Tax=unclassified Streptomyces TaxID=2593676 RepID=UPI0033BBBF82
MLFTREALDKIASGETDLAFRSWRRPAVRPGTRLRTAVGLIEVTAVEPVAADAVTARDARRAGYPDRAALLADQRADDDRRLYRVTLRHAGADPRTALREDTALGPDALAAVVAALDGIDARSTRGPWTRTVLGLLHDHPATRAADLAARVDRDTLPFKADVRRLKEHGLTESLDIGYRLSPRGEKVWRHLQERDGDDTPRS